MVGVVVGIVGLFDDAVQHRLEDVVALVGQYFPRVEYGIYVLQLSCHLVSGFVIDHTELLFGRVQPYFVQPVDTSAHRYGLLFSPDIYCKTLVDVELVAYYAHRRSTQVELEKVSEELLYDLFLDDVQTVQLRVAGASGLLQEQFAGESLAHHAV